MLDILVYLAKELFGQEKKAAPRRQVRPADSTARSRAGSAPARPTQPARREEPPRQPDSFDDMMRQFFGVSEEQAEEAAPPPPPPPPPPPREHRRPQPQPEREKKPAPAETEQLKGSPSVMRAYRKAEADQAAAAIAQQAETVVSGTVAPAAAVAQPTDFITRLRNNPNAAREAFVYHEIFGTPLADRPPEDL